MHTTTWIAEVEIEGKWVVVARCESKFVASLALVRFEMSYLPTRLTEAK